MTDPDRTPWKQTITLFLLLFLGMVAALLWPATADVGTLFGAQEDFAGRDPYQVRILRDTWGVPHIFGETDAGAAFGLAYAHAEDDFLTIQQTLLAARGQLAAVYGREAAANDYMVRLLRIWDVVEAGYERDLQPETRAIVEAYAAGLNEYARRHPGQILAARLFPLSGRDIVAVSVHKSPLFFGLENTLAELFAGTRQREVSPRPAAGSALWFDTAYGSNTLSVGPSRSADGSTFLAVNAHQPWEGPTTWYEAHVHSEEGWDMAGATFPVTPVIVHGHNRYLGWAFTVNHPDLADVYVLETNPENPNQYRFDGRWLDFEVRREPIEVRIVGRFVWPVQQEFLWSVYGPAVRQDHGTYAIRYAGWGRVDIFEQLYRMNKATSFTEWQAAVRDGGLPNFNIGYADREGNIYYLYNALLPVRAEGYDWSLYLPGDTSETLWSEYLPFEQLPQVFNPPSGFIQNANSTPFRTTLGPGNPDPAEYSPTLGIETEMTNRALRALELLSGDPAITFEEFTRYKMDWTYSAESDVPRIVAILLDQPQPYNPDQAAALDILRSWDYQASPQGAGQTLFTYTLYYLLQAENSLRASALVGHALDPAQVYSAFDQAVDTVKQKFGRVDVPWREVNRLVRGDVDLGLGGGPDLLNAVYGRLQEDGRFKGFQGDSYVMLVAWDTEGKVRSYSIHQYGSATLDTRSPHYADQAPLFVQRALKPVWLDEAEIRMHLDREYRPGE